MMNLKQARQLLNLSDSADVAEVKRAYHAAAKLSHPDRGGLAAEFARLNQAYKIALAHCGEESCPHCGGSGFIEVTVGWETFKKRCKHCGSKTKSRRDD